MTETVFCYCCRVHHDKNQMRLFPTRQGHRWRCLRSIAAAQLPVETRDTLGRLQSQENRAQASRAAQNSVQLRHSRQAFA